MEYARYVKVMPSTGETPIYPPELYPDRRAKLDTFDDGSDIPRTVPVSIVSYEYPLTANKLHVKLAKKRVPLAQWLLSLPKWPLLGKEGIVAQQKWWDMNKKAFSFTKLPLEIRMIVYEYALGPNISEEPMRGGISFLGTLQALECTHRIWHR
jgi:hypothetical protein